VLTELTRLIVHYPRDLYLLCAETVSPFSTYILCGDGVVDSSVECSH